MFTRRPIVMLKMPTNLENVIVKYSCPISHQVMFDPVFARDGHTYEREEIEKHIAFCAAKFKPIISPIDGSDITPHPETPMTPNRHLASEIKELLTHNPTLWSEVYSSSRLREQILSNFTEERLESCLRLLEQDPRVLNEPIKEGKTLFELACSQSSTLLLKRFIEYLTQKKMNIRDNFKATQFNLFQSVLLHQGKAGVKALEKIFYWFSSDYEAQTWEAISTNQPVLLQACCELLGDATVLKMHKTGGVSLLQFAVQLGRVEICQFLGKTYPDLLKQTDSDHNTLLHIAAAIGDLTLVTWLIAQNLNCLASNKAGELPLQRAIHHDHAPEIMHSLIRAVEPEALFKALVNSFDVENIRVVAPYVSWNLSFYEKQAWLYAQQGAVNEIEVCFDLGVNPHTAYTEKRTHLIHIAAEQGFLLLLSLLFERSVDIDTPDAEGNTALHLAARTGKREMIDTLLDHGADGKRTNQQGQTPAQVAMAAEHHELAKYIEQKRREFKWQMFTQLLHQQLQQLEKKCQLQTAVIESQQWAFHRVANYSSATATPPFFFTKKAPALPSAKEMQVLDITPHGHILLLDSSHNVTLWDPQPQQVIAKLEAPEVLLLKQGPIFVDLLVAELQQPDEALKILALKLLINFGWTTPTLAQTLNTLLEGPVSPVTYYAALTAIQLKLSHPKLNDVLEAALAHSDADIVSKTEKAMVASHYGSPALLKQFLNIKLKEYSLSKEEKAYLKATGSVYLGLRMALKCIKTFDERKVSRALEFIERIKLMTPEIALCLCQFLEEHPKAKEDYSSLLSEALCISRCIKQVDSSAVIVQGLLKLLAHPNLNVVHFTLEVISDSINKFPIPEVVTALFKIMTQWEQPDGYVSYTITRYEVNACFKALGPCPEVIAGLLALFQHGSEKLFEEGLTILKELNPSVLALESLMPIIIARIETSKEWSRTQQEQHYLMCSQLMLQAPLTDTLQPIVLTLLKDKESCLRHLDLVVHYVKQTQALPPALTLTTLMDFYLEQNRSRDKVGNILMALKPEPVIGEQLKQILTKAESYDKKHHLMAMLTRLSKFNPELESFLLSYLNDPENPLTRTLVEELRNLSQLAPSLIVSLKALLKQTIPSLAQEAARTLIHFKLWKTELFTYLSQQNNRDFYYNWEYAASIHADPVPFINALEVAYQANTFSASQPSFNSLLEKALSALKKANTPEQDLSALLKPFLQSNKPDDLFEKAELLKRNHVSFPDVLITQLIKLLKGSVSEPTREDAAKWLGEAGIAQPDMIRTLNDAVQTDKSWNVKRQAACALGQLKAAKADTCRWVLDDLVVALKGNQKDFSPSQAVSDLLRLGVVTPQIIKALIRYVEQRLLEPQTESSEPISADEFDAILSFLNKAATGEQETVALFLVKIAENQKLEEAYRVQAIRSFSESTIKYASVMKQFISFIQQLDNQKVFEAIQVYFKKVPFTQEIAEGLKQLLQAPNAVARKYGLILLQKQAETLNEIAKKLNEDYNAVMEAVKELELKVEGAQAQPATVSLRK